MKKYYVLRKINPESKYEVDTYLYIHGKLSMWGADYKIGSAIL